MRYAWLALFIAFFLWSAIEPNDRLTWIFEVAPAVIGVVLILLTWNSFRLTTLLYVLILLHMVVLMVGGHYTYAEVPLFDVIKPWFGFERNNYDKLGHFMQGFVPAILAREILLRKKAVNGRGWLGLFVISICLAFSAFYDLIEWWAALVVGEDADSFLATQGYIWDTQSDMAWALFGAAMALILLSRYHDRQLATLSTP